MKQLLRIILCFIIVLECTGCFSLPTFECGSGIHDDVYVVARISSTEVAIGNMTLSSGNEVYFIPEKISGYIVTQIGYPSGWGVAQGNGSLHDFSQNKVSCFYYPSTIKTLHPNYFADYSYEFKVMYCGAVINLNELDLNGVISFYVPPLDYNDYLIYFDGLRRNTLYKANVIYDLNYESKKYYYVDYVENGNVIENVPPIPERDGYTFDGWYTDNEFNYKWDFENDNIVFNETISEVYLYAKWVIVEENNK